MDPLQVDVLLQLPSQVDLSAVLAHRPIVHQQKVGVETVENVQLAEWIQQRLVGSDDLRIPGEQKKQLQTAQTSTLIRPWSHSRLCR